MEDWDGKRWSSGVKLNWILGKSAGNPYIIAVPPHPPKKNKKNAWFPVGYLRNQASDVGGDAQPLHVGILR